MSFLSKLFGGKSAPAAEAETYQGFRIFAEPKSEAGGYRLAARIEKEIDGQLKTHHLLRADTIQSLEEAEAFSIRKAKQVIDEQGDGLFG